MPANTEPVCPIVFELRQLDVSASLVLANRANNSFSLTTLPRSFALASIIVSPFLHLSGRVNRWERLADVLAVRASLEHFKGGFFELVVIITSWHVLLHHFDDVLFAGGLLSRPTLRGIRVLLAKENIGFVQLGVRQFPVRALAEAVDRVDAGVVYRPGERLFGDLV